MTALTWDRPGERRYETGVDHGVLYLPGGGAVPWNGLTSVSENRSRDVKSYFMDGVKYLDHSTPGVYSGKIQAFTYPDELDALLGNVEIAPGVLAYDQQAKPFSLSYRTSLANDLEGSDYAYKIHLVYNVTASPSDATFSTIAESVAGDTFEWNLSAVPEALAGIRPTSHISLDSRRVDPATLESLKLILYGSASADPYMPSLVALAGMVA